MEPWHYTILFFMAASAFIGFNELLLMPYMVATDYVDLERKQAEPGRSWIVLFISLLDYFLICIGTWAGYNMIYLTVNSHEGDL